MAAICGDEAGMNPRVRLERHERRRGWGSSIKSRFGAVALAVSRLPSLLPFWWSRVLFPGHAPDGVKWTGRSWAALALLMLVAGVVLFPRLSYPLFEPDEGRYAEIPREMIASGDWLVPTLNFRTYYDKPPLAYWLVAASYQCFGISERSARLVPTTCSFLTVLATFLFGRRVLGERPALLAALTLTVSMGFVCFGRFLTLDSILSLSVALSLFTAYEAVRGERFRWGWWLASAVCCGVGIMTKGPIALVLLGPPVAAYGWLRRPATRVGVARWAALIGVALALAAPWFVALTLRDPSFAHHFFWRHHVNRFFLGEFHDKPWWFYIPVLLFSGMPWSLLVLPVSRFLFSPAAGLRSLRSKPMGFMLLWAGWCVLFFSLSRGKLPPYILPALPALALVLGCYLNQVVFAGSFVGRVQTALASRPQHIVAVLCGAAIVVGTGAWLLRLRNRNDFLIEAALWGTCIIALAIFARRLRPKLAWALCGIVGFIVISVWTQQLFPAWARRHSPLGQSRELAALLRDDHTAVACYGREWGSLPFYSRRNDIHNFSNRPTEELKEFLASRPRTLLIIKNSAELDWFRAMVPAGMQLTRLGETSDLIYSFVEPMADSHASRFTSAAGN